MHQSGHVLKSSQVKSTYCVQARSGHSSQPTTDELEIAVVDLFGATLIGTVCHKVWSRSGCSQGKLQLC